MKSLKYFSKTVRSLLLRRPHSVPEDVAPRRLPSLSKVTHHISSRRPHDTGSHTDALHMASPEWNFGHVAGACDVGYLGVGDDAKLVTCGADNAVYVRNPTSGEVEHSFTETHGDAVNVLCVAPNGGDKFVTGSDDCSVKLFSFDGTKIAGEFEKNVTRFSLPVRALAWSTDGTFLAAGGEDSMVKVVDMSDNSIAMELPHRGKCIKSVSFDPKGEFLSACDDAGVLTVWALKTITKKDGGDDDDDENADDDTHKSSIEPGDSVMSATVAPVT